MEKDKPPSGEEVLIKGSETEVEALGGDLKQSQLFLAFRVRTLD